MSHKIAIIGPVDTISGFRALGVTPFPASTGEEALEVLRAIKKNIDESGRNAEATYAVILIIESIANMIAPDDMEKVSRGALPAVLSLPGIEGTTGAGNRKLRKLAEQAIGSDILG